MKIDRLNKCPDRMVRPPSKTKIAPFSSSFLSFRLENPEHFIEQFVMKVMLKTKSRSSPCFSRDESDRLTDHEEDEEEIEEEVEMKVNGDDQGPLIPKKEK